ncbi:MAG: pentapeptide repeat-containing protein, partial [Thermoanaerobaculales bacterium]|nr:pentapeptide repeat-containing protein [Thermoanaerobaculales bacterium]
TPALYAPVLGGGTIRDLPLPKGILDKVSELDLQGRDLRYADFRNSVLPKVNMLGANLRGARFERARLDYAALGCATLENTRFSQAWMTGASFTPPRSAGGGLRRCPDGGQSTRLEDCDLKEARLDGARLRWLKSKDSDFSSALMVGSDLTESVFDGSKLQYVDLRGADLYRARITQADALGADFSFASLRCVRFVKSDLRGARFAAATLAGVSLQETTLATTDLDHADLRNLSGDVESIGAQIDSRPAQPPPEVIMPALDPPPCALCSPGTGFDFADCCPPNYIFRFRNGVLKRMTSEVAFCDNENLARGIVGRILEWPELYSGMWPEIEPMLRDGTCEAWSKVPQEARHAAEHVMKTAGDTRFDPHENREGESCPEVSVSP